MMASEHYLHEMGRAIREWHQDSVRSSRGVRQCMQASKREPIQLSGGCLLYRLNTESQPCAI